MSTVNYTEIIFKIKEEYIKHTRVNEDGSVHCTLEMPVAEQVCPHCGARTLVWNLKVFQQAFIHLFVTQDTYKTMFLMV